MSEYLSELPVQLCLNKVNELDDKIVWTTVLEMETDGGEKSESCHVGEFMRKGRDGGEGRGRGAKNVNMEKCKHKNVSDR